MSLADVVKSAVATAQDITASLQADITLEQWNGTSTRSGGPAYTAGAEITLPAIVEPKQRLVRDNTGDLVLTRTKVTIIQPVTAQGAAGRNEPIDVKDRITLPDGTTGPILRTDGIVNPQTNAPYMLEVWLG